MDKEEVTLEDGRVGYKYPGGEIRDEKGSFMVQPPFAAPTITKDTASDLAARRWELVREHVAEGVVEGSIAKCEMDAVKRISSAQARLSIDTEKGHASTKAAEFVFRAAQWIRPREGGGVTVQVANVQLPPGVLRALGIDAGGGNNGEIQE